MAKAPRWERARSKTEKEEECALHDDGQAEPDQEQLIGYICFFLSLNGMGGWPSLHMTSDLCVRTLLLTSPSRPSLPGLSMTTLRSPLRSCPSAEGMSYGYSRGRVLADWTAGAFAPCMASRGLCLQTESSSCLLARHPSPASPQPLSPSLAHHVPPQSVAVRSRR